MDHRAIDKQGSGGPTGFSGRFGLPGTANFEPCLCDSYHHLVNVTNLYISSQVLFSSCDVGCNWYRRLDRLDKSHCPQKGMYVY